ncbi:MAG: MBL fold metallo-hydrolase [Elusimicrobiota bacterium]
MKIKFWGCRGSIPVPDKRMMQYGGDTTCLEVSLNNKILVIDSGTGIRNLGEDILTRDIKDIDLFITHTHWDHIHGFPFFPPIYEKDFRINILGNANSYRKIESILSKQMSIEYFPVRFSDLRATTKFIKNFESRYLEDGYKLEMIEANHPIATVGLKISRINDGEAKKTSFVFITDNELESKNPKTNRSEFVDFCRGAKYLIHDAQFTEEEYKSRTGWGHSTFKQTIELARDAKVENLVFFHHDPNRRDKELADLEQKYKEHIKKQNYNFSITTASEQDIIEIN